MTDKERKNLKPQVVANLAHSSACNDAADLLDGVRVFEDKVCSELVRQEA